MALNIDFFSSQINFFYSFWLFFLCKQQIEHIVTFEKGLNNILIYETYVDFY